MPQRTNKLSSLLLSLVFVLGLLVAPISAAVGPDVTPTQIGVAMTEDPQHSVNITWTTIDTTLMNPTVTVYADGEFVTTVAAVKTTRNVSNSNLKNAAGTAVTQKAFYNATVTGLDPDTAYTYTCNAEDVDGAEYASDGNSFKTAPAARDEFSFVYLADTQASGVNGKAITANSSFFRNEGPSFIFIAGDLTDTAANEGQWEMFFNQKATSYADNSFVNNNFENAMSDFVIAAVQGNHDNNTFANHLMYSASGGTNITYAYAYGSARFIMLNFEHTASRADQQAFLRTQVAEAKENGLWTIVGFHKSIYTGASHITDSDVINARQYWGPIFAELDVDVVLQGHDHVLSRGFVTEAGDNGGYTWKTGERSYMANKPSNAPLYYVGNCASTLKFYSVKNYSVAAGDPIVANYEFLDLNSARPAGHAQNPDGPQTDVYQGPTFTKVTVSGDSITFNTYMFKYNTSSDSITEEVFLYDSFTVTRTLPDWTEYDDTVDAANDFLSGNFKVYTRESVSEAKSIVLGALDNNTLEFSYIIEQSEIDAAAAAIRSAMEEAQNVLGVRLEIVTPGASVKQLNGNRNELTITVKELYADNSVAVFTKTFSINNNADGIYKVGSYRVYVNTKGSTQIRDCYIVE